MIFEVGIQAACGQDDVDVNRIGGSRGNQATGGFDMRLPQNVLVGSVADQRKPTFVRVMRQLVCIGVDDHERQRLARQFPRRAAAYASGPT